MANKYLIDSNIFFQAKNLHYQFTFCREFWVWIEDGHNSDVLYSTKRVKKEIISGGAGCPVRGWVGSSRLSRFFLEDDGVKKINENYAELMRWAADRQSIGVYTYKAFSDFASGVKADAYLVAAAKYYGCAIVTHETKSEGGRGLGNIKIPNAADVLGVKIVSLYELLRLHAGPSFAFK